MLGEDALFPSIVQREVVRPNALGLYPVMTVLRLAKRERGLACLYLFPCFVSIQSFEANLQKSLESTTMRSPG